MMINKLKSVQVLTKGVEFLFKKNKVTYIKGKGVLLSKNNVVVYNEGKKTSYNRKSINLIMDLIRRKSELIKSKNKKK